MDFYKNKNILGLLFSLIGLLSSQLAFAGPYSDAVLADTPIAYWKLDETTGTTAVDSSGNGYDATYINGSTLNQSGAVTDPTNLAASLNGTDQYIQLPDNQQFDLNVFTFEAWVKKNVTDTNAIFVNFPLGAHFDGRGIILRGSNKLTLQWGNGINSWESFSGNVTIGDGNWHHIVVIFDYSNTLATIYVDGIKDIEHTITQPINYANQPSGTTTQDILRIGAEQEVQLPITDYRFYDGTIDEIAFYDYALTAGRVKEHYNLGKIGKITPESYEEQVLVDDPVAYWKLDESSGTTAVDATGNGHDGTISNVGLNQQNLITTGNSANFDGASSRIDVSASPALALTGDVTVEAWLKMDQIPVDRYTILSYAGDLNFDTSDQNIQYELRISNGKLEYSHEFGPGTNQIYESTFTLFPNKTYHYVAVRDDSNKTVDFYIDGQKVDTYTYTNAPDGGEAASLSIGVSNGPFYFLDGLLDEVAVYSHTLTPQQIQAHYNLGKIGKTAPVTYEDYVKLDSPLGYWKLDETAGTTAIDSSGNSYDGIYTNSPVLGLQGINSEGSAVDFDGDNDYVELGNIDAADPLALAGSSFTLEAWIKPDLTGDTYQRIIDKTTGGAGAGGYAMALSPGGRLFLYIDGNQFQTDVGVVYPGIWQHVIVTNNTETSSYQFYLNGSAINGTLVTAPYQSPPAVTSNMRLGTWNHSDAREYNGLLDEVAVYDYTLTPAQVQQHYAVITNSTNVGPTLAANLPLDVTEGTSGSITSSLLAATDPDDTPADLTYTVSAGPDQGQLEFSDAPGVAITQFTQADIDNGRVVYVHNGSEPPPTDSFDFSLADGGENGAAPVVASFTINLTAVNDIPVALDDNQLLPDFNPVIIDVLANDSDEESSTLTITAITQGLTGTVTNNSTTVTYTPSPLLFGSTDSFTYTIDDGTGGVATAVVHVYFDSYTPQIISQSPVAYWKLDETSGITAVDSAGTNDATYINSPLLGEPGVLPPGTNNHAVSFDRNSSQYLDLGNNSNLNLTNYTIGFWFNPKTALDSNLPDLAGLISLIPGTNNGINILYDPIAQSLSISHGAGGTWNSIYYPTTLDANQWYYLAVSFDGTTRTMYLNGNPVASDSPPAPEWTGTNNYYIAKGGEGLNQYFDGRMDEIVVYDKSLTQQQVQGLYNLGKIGKTTPATYGDYIKLDTPLAYWKLNENSGTKAIDYSGNGYVGVYTNSPVLGVPGKLPGDTAVEFDGDNDYVELGSIDAADPLALAGTSFTLETWIKPDLTGDNSQRIIDKSSNVNATNGYFLAVGPNGAILFYVNQTPYQTAAGTVSPGLWQHIVAVDDNGTDYRVYVNGVLVSGVLSSTFTFAPAITTNMRLGTWNHSTGREYNGVLDEVAIYNHALTPAQIQQHYAIVVDTTNIGPTLVTNLPLTVAEGGSGTISSSLLAGTDPDDTPAGLTYTVAAGPAQGQLEFSDMPGVAITQFTQEDVNNGRVVYIHNGSEPPPGDSFDFSLADGGENGALPVTGTFNITLTPVNDAPVAVDDSATTGTAIGVTVDVLANDSDAENDSLAITGVTQGSNGVVVNNGTNVTYTSNAGFTGTDSFTYTVDDGNGGSATATVSVTVTDGYTFSVLNDSPIAYWKLGETSGTTAADSSGNGYDGVYTNSPILGAPGRFPGETAVEFDGDNDYVELGSIDAADSLALAGSAFTLEAWINPDLTGDSSQRIIDKSNDSTGLGGYALTISPNGDIRFLVDGNRYRTDAGVVGTGVWQHVVAVNDGVSGQKVYVDGIEVNGSIDIGVFSLAPATTTNMRLGTWNHSDAREYNGVMNQIAIYNYALSLSQIQQHYSVVIDSTNIGPTLATNLPLTLSEGSTGAIDSSLLAATDPDDVAAGLTYSVTNPPLHGQLEFNDNPGISINSFTQADVDAGRLQYAHDASQPWSEVNTIPSVIELSSLDGSNGFALNGISAGDRSGGYVSSAGDINNDGYDDIYIASNFAEVGSTVNAGQAYIIYGRAGGFPASIDLNNLAVSDGFAINGIAADDHAGFSTSSVITGDVNGDQIDDLIIGARDAEGSGTQVGQTYIIFGQSSNFPATFNLSGLDGTNGFILNGISDNDRSGYAVSIADVNNDGFGDVITSAPNAAPNAVSNAGQTYVVFGHAGPYPAQLSLSTLDGTNGFVLNGFEADENSGWSASDAGDINGDGIHDFMISSINADANGLVDSGRVYVIYGKTQGYSPVIDLSALGVNDGFTINGIAAGGQTGRIISPAGDVNHDGHDDIIIGAAPADPNGVTNAGSSYIIFGRGNNFPGTFDLSSLNGGNGFIINGANQGDNSGIAVSAAGDINHDGIDDILIGAFHADPNGLSGAGQTYVIYGKSNGFPASMDLSTVDGTNGFTVNGITASDFSGVSVSNIGDVNGDGVPDIIIGAMQADWNTGVDTGPGHSYVIFGQPGFADRFDFSLADGGENNAQPVLDTFLIDVAPVNDAPVAVDDNPKLSDLNPAVINVLANDSDEDHDTLTITAVTQGTYGTVTHNGTTVTYTPSPAFTYIDSFTYTIDDGQGGTATATVSVYYDRHAAQVLTDDPVAYWRLDEAAPTASYQYPGSTAGVNVISQTFNTSARYVNVSLPGSSRILQLAEVEVYALVNGQTVNVALGKPATSSSIRLASDVPGLAVDGNTDGNYSNGSVFHSMAGSEIEPWWEVDLGKNYTITEVRIYNRTDCCDDRLSDVSIRLSDTPGVAVDSTGNDHSGAYFSSVALGQSGITGNYGTSASFDGTATASVDVNNHSDFQINSGTVIAWIKTADSGTGIHGIVVKQAAYGLFLKDNNLMSYDWNTAGTGGTELPANINLADDQWHMVAMSFDSGVSNGTKLYVDGQEVLTTSMSIGNQNNDLMIGSGFADGSSQNFTGLIDEVSVYDHLLTGTQIQQQYNLGHVVLPGNQSFADFVQNTLGATHLWEFEETDTVQPALDTIGGANGNYSTTNIELNTPGLFYSGNAVRVTNNTAVSGLNVALTPPYSLSLLIKPESTTPAVQGLINQVSANTGLFIWSGKIGWAQNSGSWPVLSTNTVTLGQTYSIVFSVDAARNGKLYVNGELWAQGSGIVDFTINKLAGNAVSQLYTGTIDQVTAYGQALSQQDVGQLGGFLNGTIDNQAPLVDLTYPHAATSLYQGIITTLQADATDNIAVESVDFLVDSVVVNTDTSAPYSYDYTVPAAATSLTFQAVARDFNGNEAASTEQTLTVNPLTLGANQHLMVVESLYAPENLPVLRKVVTLPDFTDQYQLAQAARDVANSGWGLNITVSDLDPSHNWTGGSEAQIFGPVAATESLGFPATGNRHMIFHTDDTISRGSFDICEAPDNFSIISGLSDSGGVTSCVVSNWGQFYLDNYPAVVASITPADGTFTDATSALTVKFMWPIQAGTFTAADIGISGPQAATVSTINTSDNRTFTVDLTAPLNTDGTYTVTIGPDITSQSGNGMDQNGDNVTGDTFTSTFSIDANAPVITVTEPVDGTVTNVVDQVISGSLSEPAELKLNGVLVPVAGDNTFSIGPVTLVEGSNAFTLTATDAAQNSSSVTVTVTLDSQAPVITINSPADGLLTTNSTLTVTGSLNESGNLTINTVPVTLDAGNNFSQNISLNEGVNTINFVATDDVGNPSTASITVTLDSIAPVITVTSPTDGSTLNQSVATITGSLSEPAGLTLDGTPVTVAGDNSFSQGVTLVNGVNTFNLVATDAAGNQSNQTLTVTLEDTVPPTISVTGPPDGLLTNQVTQTITGSLDEPANLTINGNSVTLGAGNSFSYSLDLAEGANTITIIAEDAATNSSTVTLNLTLDTIAPTVIVTAPADGLVTSQVAQTITGSIDEAATLKINGNDVTLGAGNSFSINTDLAEGDNVFTLAATDNAGNTSSQTLTLTLDTIAPVITVTGPQNGLKTNQATVLVTGSLNEPGTLTINTMDVTVQADNSFSQSVTLTEGANAIVITAKDGLQNTATKTVNVTLDSQAPVITINSPADGSTLNQSVTAIVGSLNEPADLTINGAAVTLGAGNTFNYPTTLAAGPNTFTLVATDGVGNQSTVTLNLILDDTTAPTITINSPQDGLVTSQSVQTVSGHIDEAGSVTVNGVSVTPDTDNNFSQDVTLTEGANTITVVATDNFTNSSTVTINVTLDTTTPVITVTAPADGTTTSQASQTITGSLDEPAVLTINGTAITLGAGNSFSHTLGLTEGSNTITLQATDAAGNVGSQSLTLTLDTGAPVITISGPADGLITNQASQTITGSLSEAASLKLNGTDVTVAGDNSFSQGVTLVEGSNTFTLTVTDALGNSSSVVLTLTLDTTAPVITVTNLNDGDVLDQAVLILQGSLSETAALTINGNAVTVTNNSFSHNLVLTNGANSIVLQATDAAGNVVSKTLNVTLNDSTAPTITITSPQDGLVTSQAAQTIIGSIDEPGTVKINGVDVSLDANNQFSQGITLADGVNTVTIVASDLATNTSTKLLTLVLDNGAPASPTITSHSVSPAVNLASSKTITVSGGREDNTAIYINGVQKVASGSGDWITSLTLPEGLSDLTITAVDQAANSSAPVVVTVRVDTTAPVVSGVGPAGLLNTDPGSVVVNFTESGSGIDSAASKVTVIRNAAAVSGTLAVNASQLTFTPDAALLEGVYTVRPELKDIAGNLSAINDYSFTLDFTPPSAPVLSAYPATTSINTVTFNGTKDLGSAIYVDGVQVVGFTNNTTWSYQATLQPGSNSIAFVARDKAGNDSTPTVANVDFADAAPGAVTVSANVQGDGKQIQLSWNGYDEFANGNDIQEYRIYQAAADFTDTSAATLISTVAAGTKTVTVSGLTRGLQQYYAVVAADIQGNASSTVTAIAATPVDIVAPANVSGLNAGSFADRLAISWNALPAGVDDLAGFKLYVDSDTTGIAIDKALTQYDLTGLTAATGYALRLTAIDNDGNENSGASLNAATLLANPTSISTTPFSKLVSLNWTHSQPQSLVKQYKIYAESYNFGSSTVGLTAKATVSGTVSQGSVAGLTNGTQYWFAVAAVNISNGEAKTVTTVTETPEADSQGPDLSQFLFDAATLVDGMTITKSGQLKVHAQDLSGVSRVEFYVDGILIGTDTSPSSGSYDTFWNVVAVTDGVHTLAIQAFDTLNNSTTQTFNVTVALAPPAAPTIIKPAGDLTTNNNQQAISGQAEANTRVQLYNNSVAIGTPITVNSQGQFSASIGLTPGANVITATAEFLGRGSASAPSAGRTLTLDTSVPDAPTGLAVASRALGEIRVSWNSNPDGRVQGYNLYRSASPFTAITDSGVQKINSNLIKGTAFTDLPVPDGSYYYRLTAVNELGSQSLPSQQVEGVADSVGPRALSIDYTPSGNYDVNSGRVAPGPVDVVVHFSEPLRTAPYFALTPEGGVPTTIALTKDRTDDTLYKGNFVIEANTPTGLAYAVLTAHDVLGNRGTDIDSGATLLIDSDGPEALSIQTTPVNPIQVDPLQPESTRTVAVTLQLSDDMAPGTVPLLVPQLDGLPIVGLSQGIDLTYDDTNSQPGQPIWNGSFVLPVTAGQDANGNPGVQILSFSYQGADDLGNQETKINGPNQIQVYQGNLPPVAIPFGLKAVAIQDGQVQLSWSKVDGASGYVLYRKAFDETGFTELLTLAGGQLEQYVDDGSHGHQNVAATGLIDGIYQYAIASLRDENSQSSESGMSDPVTVTADGTAPNPPQNLALTLNGAGIVSEWLPPTGEVDLSKIKYNLYRLPIAANDPVDLTGVTPLQTGIPEPIALDSKPSQQAHTYVVTAVDAAGNESDPSPSQFLNFDLLPVSDLNIDLTEQGFPHLTWDHGGATIAGYDVYAGSIDPANKLNAAGLVLQKEFTDNSYNNGFPSDGAAQQRTYVVVAVDDQATESIGHSLTLPALSVSLKDASQQVVERGVMNQLTFRVDNNGQTDATGVKLHVSVDDNGTLRDHVSDSFSVQANNFTFVTVVVGGYDNLSNFIELQERLTQTPQTGEEVNIYQTEAIDAGDSTLPISLTTENFTRGATGQARFTVENTSAVETELVMATASGNNPSNEIRLVLEDLDGNVLSTQPVKQFGGGVISIGSGQSVARIAAGGSFTSEPISIAVPSAAPDKVKLKLVIDKYHYHLGQPTHVAIAGKNAQRNVTLVETPYYAEVTDLSPGVVFGTGEPITITGRALARSTNAPLGNVPIKLAFRVRGFERTATIYTDTLGNYSYDYVPAAGESGTYTVSAIHPEVVDRPVQGQFTVQVAGIKPTQINVNMPRNFNQKLNLHATTGYATPLDNLHVEYLQSDQINQVLPTGITINSGAAINLAANKTGVLTPIISGDNTAADTGAVRLRVVSDSLADPLGFVTVNYTLSEAVPSLTYKPSFVETGLGKGQTVTEQVVLENKGLASMDNVRLSLVNPDGTPAPAWLYLTSAANLGDIPVGAPQTVSITASPSTSVIENDYEFRLRVESDNQPTREIQIFVAVTQSGIGDIFFHAADIFTATLDNNALPIPGLAGARIRLQNEQVLTQEYVASTDSNGELLFQDIPAGRYIYRASASNHQDVTGRIIIKPGITVAQEVFLTNQVVTVEWSVTEVTIQDKYEIKLEATYETSVPIAVVVFDPLSVNLPVMEEGEVFYGEARLTNHGLIRADNVATTLPPANDYFKIEFMTDVPDTLEAGEVFIVPYRVTALRDFNPGVTGDATGGGCFNITERVDTKYQSICAFGSVVPGSTQMIYHASSGAASCSAPPVVISSGGSSNVTSSVGGGDGGVNYSRAPVPISQEGVPECLAAGGNACNPEDGNAQ